MRSLCVFCGSSAGARPEYARAALELGRCLAARRIRLVYGGAQVGVMGKVAAAVLEQGGEVVGVMPRGLARREIVHDGLTELHLTDTMHERKALMCELSDGFIALPGGLGTLDELMETFTWAQLGIHLKPCGLLNVSRYYDGLLAFLDHATTEEFMAPGHRSMLMVEENPEALLDRFEGYVPPQVDKLRWVVR